MESASWRNRCRTPFRRACLVRFPIVGRYVAFVGDGDGGIIVGPLEKVALDYVTLVDLVAPRRGGGMEEEYY